MKKYLLLLLFIPLLFVSVGCSSSSIPNLKLICKVGENEVRYETNINTNSLNGDDGTSTIFYKDDFFEIVFINFDESGKPIRIVNYYPTDPGIEIIENGISTTCMCEHNHSN